MNVAIAWTEDGDGRECTLDLGDRECLTIADVLALAAARGMELPAFAAAGVWGSVRPLNHVLRDGDRIELYRPLEADPRAARRARAARER